MSGLADFINQLAKILPQWSFTHDVASDVSLLTPYFQKAGVLFPIDTVLTVLGIWLGLQLLLIALYWIDRLINLVRGAG